MAIAPRALTKSDLQSLIQCPRKLWLEHRKPELIPKNDPALYRRTTDGDIVGEKAREQLGSDTIRPPIGNDKAQAAAEARALLDREPGRPAVEMPMLHRGLYAAADALIPEGDRFTLRETKASTFPLGRDKATPGDPKEHHLNDVAIQAWVMEGSGLPLARIELNLLDNQWRYSGAGDYSGLFRQLDVTVAAGARKSEVPRWLDEARTVLAGDQPEAVTGAQCSDPFQCPFEAYCVTRDPPRPEHPIELLPGSSGKSLARRLRETQGYTSILDPRPEELAGKEAGLFRRMQTAHRKNGSVLEPGSGDFLRALPYPRYYFDFEGIDLPVPRWSGVRPYEQVPFQWSCHVERSHGVFEHAEFLDLTGRDPSCGCIERMRSVIDPDDGGPIVVYHMTYEKSLLAGMRTRHPAQSELLHGYIGRLVDLLPLVKEHFYHPRMRGSFSIKRVLPVIAPDLDYESLEEVQDGTGAQVAYIYATLDPSASELRTADLDAKLRKYCRQDTWAMVEVAYFLSGLGRPRRPAGE